MKNGTPASWASRLLILLILGGSYPATGFDGHGPTRVDRSVPAAPAAAIGVMPAGWDVGDADSAGPAGPAGRDPGFRIAEGPCRTGLALRDRVPSPALQGFLARPTRAPPTLSG